MTPRKPYRPVGTGVNFHPAVIRYLNELCEVEDCDRSALLNRIVREHARQHGGALEPIAAQARIARCAKVI
jgi:hypothetical protein